MAHTFLGKITCDIMVLQQSAYEAIPPKEVLDESQIFSEIVRFLQVTLGCFRPLK